MEVNKIIQGDCLEILKTLPDKSVDLVLTDIPYGEVNRNSNGLRNLDKGDADEVNFSLDELMGELLRVTSGSLYIFCGTGQLSDIHKKLVQNDLSTRLVIWEKTNPSPMNGEHIWLSGIEFAVFGKKSGATFNEFCKNSVLRFPSKSSTEHPTEKPLDLFRKLITASSKESDLILDPFLGSGTTAVAAKMEGRNYIGIEISEKYCEIARQRVASAPSPLFV